MYYITYVLYYIKYTLYYITYALYYIIYIMCYIKFPNKFSYTYVKLLESTTTFFFLSHFSEHVKWSKKARKRKKLYLKTLDDRLFGRQSSNWQFFFSSFTYQSTLQKKLGYVFPAKKFSIFKIIIFNFLDKVFLHKNSLNAMENLQKKFQGRSSKTPWDLSLGSV